MLFSEDKFCEDFVRLHTSYKNAVGGLMIDKYNELLENQKIFKKVGIYALRKHKTINKDELLEIKKVNYYILRNYYNNHIMPILQELNDDPSGMFNVYPIVNFQFKPLKDRSHLII
jgi:hypothetical protein